MAVRRSGAGNYFPSIALLQSAKLWQRSYFYVKNLNLARNYVNLPAYAAGPPANPRPNWSSRSQNLSISSASALARLHVMLDSERLRASDLLAVFVERRVLPLQGRPHIISTMSGRRDPCRMSTKEMPVSEIVRLVNHISDYKLSESEW